MRSLCLCALWLICFCGCVPAPQYTTRPEPEVGIESSPRAEPVVQAKREIRPLPEVGNGIDPARLDSIIARYLGIPYGLRRGRSRFDCSGFIREVFRNYSGRDLPASSSEMFRRLQPIESDAAVAGDLVFFGNNGGVSHAGIYRGNGTFAHASKSLGVTISSFGETYYRKRYLGARRVPAAR